MSVQILTGDCCEVAAGLKPESVHAVVTDPPYHFGSIVKRFSKSGGADRPESRVGAYSRHARGFMGKVWDGGDIAFQPETWLAFSACMKPGAHLVAFGGTRTFHRMAVAIEDAGFELRDTICWLYGSGFPKSRNQRDEWKGWGTALKPAFEPIIVARKPLVGTVAANLAAHRTGAINVDACRVASEGGRHRDGEASQDRRYVDAGATNFAALPEPRGGDPAGRWPANVMHDGSDEVLEAFPTAPGQQGDLNETGRTRPTKTCFGDMPPPLAHKVRNDSGSAARFFYCAKASRADRNDGLEGLPEKPLLWSAGTQNPGSFQAAGTKKSAQNAHPTVKPTELMRWLCRLVTPPGGTILDPFMGSGSTGRAAALEGFNFIGIEQEAEYVDIARRRIAASEAAALEAICT